MPLFCVLEEELQLSASATAGDCAILFAKGGKGMNNWPDAVRTMAEWIDQHIAAPRTLTDMARAIGYSPTYCSTQFHRYTGLTLREYAMQRRLYHAAIAIRDSDARLIDIAMECGYSSHQALTGAFRRAFGLSPATYRKEWRLIRLHMPLQPEKMQGGDFVLTEPNIRVEYIPAHKYLGVFRAATVDGEAIWPGHDCDLVTHTVESMGHLADVVVGAHTAGWVIRGDERAYFYGLGVPTDYEGVVPRGFELVDVPGGYYQVVSHPPFSYPADNAEVMRRVEQIAFGVNCAVRGFKWKADGQCYQRHYPEGHGYMVLRPIERA